MKSDILNADLLYKMDACWRAANCLAVGRICLCENPLRKTPLTLSRVRPLVVGHWGATPGQNFICAHLNRAINAYGPDMISIAGPGHGGPAMAGKVCLEGAWSGVYLDNPEWIVACVVGDGEAETGPLAAAWQSNKMLNPIADGAVLPILHLNGCKISNPALLARTDHGELAQFFRGCGWAPLLVDGDGPAKMHQSMASAGNQAVEEIRQIQKSAREDKNAKRPPWPMIVLRSPKGWTGAKVVDGLPVDGIFRSHHMPLLVDAEHPEHVVQHERWMKSYKAEELFDQDGRLLPELAELAPKGERRMGANPLANGGLLLRELCMPDFREHAVHLPAPGALQTQDARGLGSFLRDVVRLNQSQHAQWLTVIRELPWRRPIASLNYLLASHVWQQDHNGFTHQDPGFPDHVINKKADIVRPYLPPDANCLLSVCDHCLRSRNHANVAVAGKHALPQWPTMDAAVPHCTEVEILAAVSILRAHLPELKIRVINVVDLMRLQSNTEHPHGLSDKDCDSLCTRHKPIMFGLHGYPWLVPQLAYRRTHRDLHVRGYKEKGTITTPFDIRVQNDIDRFHRVQDAVDRLPHMGRKEACLKQVARGKLIEHRRCIEQRGQDLPAIRDWKWTATTP
ncbi:phosphoketolase family protein [Stenotrophomonas sp. YIM B06876]|uniref:phosphoketolase family protein n=1 Tax=Stenotrophomonas sp. YIM B06876 TaxID=3060211 RepID=UPI002738510F|nr:phosphoketolase family protein [Stenotrophomonas sp. YIM B06876]